MHLFFNYFYIEILKNFRSKYFFIISFSLFGLIILLLIDFQNTVYKDFQIHSIYFPKANFVTFFLDKLSARIHFWTYLVILSSTIFNLELDIKSRFITYRINTIPISIIYFITAKVAIAMLYSIFLSGLLHTTVPLFTYNYFNEKNITLENVILFNTFLHWLKQSLIIPTTIICIITFIVYFRQGLIFTIAVFLLLYFLALPLRYFYPFCIFHLVTLSTSAFDRVLDYIISIVFFFIFFFLSYIKLKNYA